MAAPVNLERLYEEHAQALFAFLLNLTRHDTDTRDLLQDLFIRLARRPDLLDDVRDERAFLLRMAHNLALDLIRRRSTREKNYERFAAEVPALFAPSLDADEAVFRRRLQEALAELPTDQRAVLHLKLWENLTFDAIAEALGIPANTAASRYRYGLDKLRQKLRPLYEEIK